MCVHTLCRYICIYCVWYREIFYICVPLGLKRVTLSKDPVKGIGCTIKSAAGHIFVNSITEGGPIAFTGVLRPGEKDITVITNLVHMFTS